MSQLEELEQELKAWIEKETIALKHKHELVEKIHRLKTETYEKQDCPRHGIVSEVFNYDSQDYWEPRAGNLFCSYCGSLRATELLEWMRTTTTGYLEHTDKSYKFYIHGHPNSTAIKFYTPHLDILTHEQIDELNELEKKLRSNYKPFDQHKVGL